MISNPMGGYIMAADNNNTEEMKIEEIKKEAKESQDAFMRQLQDLRESQDKYGVVKEYFGGLVFNTGSSQAFNKTRKLTP